jgi:hypothetical protein
MAGAGNELSPAEVGGLSTTPARTRRPMPTRNDSMSFETCTDPDELDDRADDLEVEALRIRQQARRLRQAGASARWLDDAACRAKYGHGIGVFVSAAKRGDCEIGRAGRSPRVREDVADRYVATRGSRRAKPEPLASVTSLYDLAVEKVRAS